MLLMWGLEKMGDRVSIQFKNGEEKSVVLFSHWDGMDIVRYAKKYVKELRKEIGDSEFSPLDRLEPRIVMVDFIREITNKKQRVRNNYYLVVNEFQGDNSDNGHFIINLKKEQKKVLKKEQKKVLKKEQKKVQKKRGIKK